MSSLVIEELTKFSGSPGQKLEGHRSDQFWKELHAPLCISALRHFKTVRYIRSSHLIDKLYTEEALGSYRELLAQLAAYGLLMVDDFGLM